MTETFRSGLEGVVAAETRLSEVDGLAGRLTLVGLPVEILAPTATFEETLHLFWQGELPDRQQQEWTRRQLQARRSLSSSTLGLLEEAAARHLDGMEALRMAVASLGLEAGGDDDREQALRCVAQLPSMVATYWRLLAGEQPIEPSPALAHVANYLYMLEGEAPTAERVRALETYLNTVVDHGMNASTFTARVIISTRSDMVSAILGAIGALKGPLHGGAPGPALDMVFEIGKAERAEDVIQAKLDRGERLMGFGHRVYKVRDPRADVLSDAANQLAEHGDSRRLNELARAVEQVVLRLLEKQKPGRRLQTNVEYYTALLLHSIGLHKQLFTPSFAVARVVGWTAHCFEQLENGRLIRPSSRYVGPRAGQWTPLDQR